MPAGVVWAVVVEMVADLIGIVADYVDGCGVSISSGIVAGGGTG